MLEGELIVVPNGASLPDVCLKCAAGPPLERRDEKLAWAPPWAMMLGVLGILLFTKKSRFALPLCSACHRRWKTWKLYGVLASLAFIPISIIALALGALVSDKVGIVLFLVGALGWLVSLVVVVALRKRRIVFARKIDKTHSWLEGVHPNALLVLTRAL